MHFEALTNKDVAVDKAYSICNRGSYKDYVDLYFILAKKHSDLSEIIDLASKKYATEFNSRLFLEQIISLDDVSGLAIQFLKETVEKSAVQNYFETEVKKLKI